MKNQKKIHEAKMEIKRQRNEEAMDIVRDFIVEYIQREYTIPNDVDIMILNYVDEGYVDSLGLIQFIAVIEDEFGITFSDEDLASSDIKVVGKMAEFVISKMEEESK